MGQGPGFGQLQPPGRGPSCEHLLEGYSKSGRSSCTPVPSVLFSMGGCNAAQPSWKIGLCL